MSLMIPRESIDALRRQVDVTLANYGIDCILYVPSVASYNEAEKLDAFTVPEDLDYIRYQAKVFIEFGASVHRLKKLGLYTENMVPIVAWWGNTAVVLDGSAAGTTVALDVCKRSWFTIDPEFIPNDYVGSEAFEVVDPVVKGIHDAIILQGWSIVPRRINA